MKLQIVYIRGESTIFDQVNAGWTHYNIKGYNCDGQCFSRFDKIKVQDCFFFNF